MPPHSVKKRSTVLASLLLSLFVTACERAPLLENMSKDSLSIRFLGSDLAWTFVYPGPDGFLDTPDDLIVRSPTDIKVPTDTSVTFQMKSEDYIYCLEITELDRREVAIPDLDYELNFKTLEARTFHLKAGQMCGLRNKNLDRQMVVVSRTEFQDWLQTITEESG